jgi:hypothetical protein
LSGSSITIRVKIGNNEVEVSGAKEEVLETLTNLSQIVGKVSEAFGGVQSSPQPPPKAIPAQTSEPTVLPSVTISPDAKCPDAIIKVLDTEWGRTAPRTQGELIEAMKVNAIFFPEGTVKGRLTDLTKKGVLRRIQTERGYGYILVKPE